MWLDRLKQTKINKLPISIAPHRYQWLGEENERLNKRSDIAKNALLVSDGIGKCQLNNIQEQHSFLKLEIENQSEVDLFESAIETITLSLQNAFEQQVSPMLPAEIINSESELLPVEENLFSVLKKGHLQAISTRPRIDIRYDEEVTDAARAKRLAKGALVHLASHSECWQKQTLSAVVPKKVLARFSEDEYNIYENIIYAKLLDKLSLYLSSRTSTLKTLLSTMNKAKDFYSSQDIDYRLSSEVCRLWGLAFNEDATERTATLLLKNLQILEEMLTSIKTLQQTGLYLLIDNKKHQIITLHHTNILNHDPHYLHVSKLWKQLENAHSAAIKKPEQRFDREQALAKAYSKYIGLVLRHALFPYLRGKEQGYWAGRQLKLQQKGLDWQLVAEYEYKKNTLCIVPWLNHALKEESNIETGDNILIVWPNLDNNLCSEGYQGNKVAISPTDMYCVERIGLAIDKKLTQWLLEEFLNPLNKIPNEALTFAKTLNNVKVQAHSLMLKDQITPDELSKLKTLLIQDNAKEQAVSLQLRQDEIIYFHLCPICQSRLAFPQDGFKQNCFLCGMTRSITENEGVRTFKQHYSINSGINFQKVGRRAFSLTLR